jgi:23S rRNA (cytidine1920-2'-O)/16S rRNA (cytidine1409-2'-O)-methyltransferase
MRKVRLDILMVARGLVESRSLAQRLVMAGQVRVDGQVALKASTSVLSNAQVEVAQPPPFVSRGGEKLEAALGAYSIDLEGRVCADVGASTGGFTDCMLQHGAQRVYAIDVGKGILAWKLRQNKRVVVMEGINARHLESLPEAVSFVSVDVSFISLKIILPVVKDWFDIASIADGSLPQATLPPTRQGEVVALVKPQFEAGRKQVARGSGVIRDAATHQQVLQEVLGFAEQDGYAVRGLCPSPLLGPKGNKEFLAWLEYPGAGRPDLEQLIAAACVEPEQRITPE